MIELNLPQAGLRFKQMAGVPYVFDPLRRRYVRFTPEEMVRQRFVNFLINHRGFPRGLMNNEVSIELNSVKYKCDTVVFDMASQPKVIVEYKAPSIIIDEAVFKQAYIYNMALHANYLMLSNGLTHYCFNIDYISGSIKAVHGIPHYQELCLNV